VLPAPNPHLAPEHQVTRAIVAPALAAALLAGFIDAHVHIIGRTLALRTRGAP